MALHGERLDRPTYSFLHSLDGGTTGELSVWDHEFFGVPVVQKTISLLGAADAVARSEPRFLEELKHPHLVRVREAQWDPEHTAVQAVTFTMDYYPGKSVHSALEEGHQFSIAVTVNIACGMLEALCFLHEDKRVLHRDVKPGNVLLDATRAIPYIADLGSAARLDDAGGTGVVAGTPLYRAPEADAGVLDCRTDLYGVGCVMLEMLNGQLPYELLDRDKIDARLAAGRRALPGRFYGTAPWVPPQLAAIVRSLLAADPERRPDSAEDALRRLRRLRVVSWSRIDGSRLVGTWRGTWPPNVPADRAREFEVSVVSIERGRYAGEVRMSARWRRAGELNRWRGYASFEQTGAAQDARALAAFFRAVEAEAQSSPT